MGDLIVIKHSVRIPKGIEDTFYIRLTGAQRGCLRFDKQDKEWILIRYIPLNEESLNGSAEVSRLEYLVATGWSDKNIRCALCIPDLYIKRSDLSV